jgi:catechol 2,3-dioxygenase-like lactoylglutathione lyase family enzyme
MLGSCKIVAFVPVKRASNARAFYEKKLGLRCVSEDEFAVVFDAQGITLRAALVPKFTPQEFTIAGWEVANIKATVSALMARGVEFQKYGLPGQDDRGIWTAPSGARVAWFKDPDGNVLSVSQHKA